MTLVNSNEFALNQQRYLNLARKEDVCIQNDEEGMYHLMYRPIERTDSKEPMYFEPDEDFYRSITMDEFLIRVKEDLRDIFKKGGK